ncbi:TadE/TadG family type IV pilus assembly protein [Methylobacterium sp. Leaf118]|uniref:TadE/TadG family type IV pilus assembly protein n=1 Tax=Methylobacterium sp. Leaf118 TaxID=2876562 RepID=UPI001E2EEAEA|nr:TadE/TadG family type IV pilus assembly protein [Methylobacterium sp. Leaf118]
MAILVYAHIALNRFGGCIKRSAANDEGSITVEFVFLAPLFLLLMLNVITGGIYIGAYHILQHTTAEAARASLAGSNDSERSLLAQQSINTALATGSLVKPQAIKLQIGSTGAGQTTYRVALSFDARSLGLSKVPGFSAIAPSTLTSSYDVRPGGM